jgi:hypothetical protein
LGRKHNIGIGFFNIVIIAVENKVGGLAFFNSDHCGRKYNMGIGFLTV